MFIKLTDRKTDKALYVNTAYIGMVYSRKSQDGDITVVELVGVETAIVRVKESVEDIVDTVRGFERILTVETED